MDQRSDKPTVFEVLKEGVHFNLSVKIDVPDRRFMPRLGPEDYDFAQHKYILPAEEWKVTVEARAAHLTLVIEEKLFVDRNIPDSAKFGEESTPRMASHMTAKLFERMLYKIIDLSQGQRQAP